MCFVKFSEICIFIGFHCITLHNFTKLLITLRNSAERYNYNIFNKRKQSLRHRKKLMLLVMINLNYYSIRANIIFPMPVLRVSIKHK